MRIKLIAAPLVAGALMAPAALFYPRSSRCRTGCFRRVE